MICRRCGHEHGLEQCPLCGQPRPDLITTAAQKRARVQKLFVTLALPTERENDLQEWLDQSNYLYKESDTIFATYQEENLTPFLKLWEQISDDSRCRLLFNGRQRPFDRDLWIPLLWLAADA